MAYENLEPGTYNATVKNATITINPYLNSPEVILDMEFDFYGEPTTMKWKGLWFAKDGSRNKKTQKTLATVGFVSEDGAQLNSFTIPQKPLTVTISKPDKYWQIDWINDPSDKKDVPQATKSLSDFFGHAHGKAGTKTLVSDSRMSRGPSDGTKNSGVTKNHALGAAPLAASDEPDFDPVQNDDEIPF